MQEETFRARLISGNRITIPDFIIKKWELNNGDRLQIIVRKPTKNIRDVII